MRKPWYLGATWISSTPVPLPLTGTLSMQRIHLAALGISGGLLPFDASPNKANFATIHRSL